MSSPEDAQPQYKPGDIVNGHVLTSENEWKAIAPALDAHAAQGSASAADKKPDRRWFTKKRFIIPAAVLLVFILAIAVTPKKAATDSAKPAAAAEAKPAAPSEEKTVEKLTVPDVTGLTAGVAAVTLQAAGFDVSGAEDPDATVTSTTPAKGGIAEAGSTVALTVEVMPKLTLAQKNAVGQAKSYLEFTAFSRSGLIDQLEYEGYSIDEATFAVDTVAPDWNAQAVAKATSYLENTSFSREGLYEQLLYEGFSDAEANAGLAGVGY